MYSYSGIHNIGLEIEIKKFESKGNSSGPSCSKRRWLNKLVKRSSREVFYDFITKNTDIFC